MALKRVLNLSVFFCLVFSGFVHAEIPRVKAPIDEVYSLLSTHSSIGDCSLKVSLIFTGENHKKTNGITITFTQDGQEHVFNYIGETTALIKTPIELLGPPGSKAGRPLSERDPYVAYHMYMAPDYSVAKIFMDPRMTPGKIIGATFNLHSGPFKEGVMQTFKCGITHYSGLQAPGKSEEKISPPVNPPMDSTSTTGKK